MRTFFKTVMNTVEEWISATGNAEVAALAKSVDEASNVFKGAQRSGPLRPSRGDDQWRVDDITEAPTLLSTVTSREVPPK